MKTFAAESYPAVAQACNRLEIMQGNRILISACRPEQF
jgi:hypothetical protein